MNNRKQQTVFLILLVVYASCAFATYAFFVEQLAASMSIPLPDLGVPNWVVGLANAGIVLVVYGLLGLAGFWFARKLDLPGIFSADGNWRTLMISLANFVSIYLLIRLYNAEGKRFFDLFEFSRAKWKKRPALVHRFQHHHPAHRRRGCVKRT